MKPWMCICVLVWAASCAGMGGELSGQPLYRNIEGEYQGLSYGDDAEAVHTNACYFSFKVRKDGALKGRTFVGGRGFHLDTYVNALGWAEDLTMRGDFWDGNLEFGPWVRFQFDQSGASGVVQAEISDFAPSDQRITMQGYRAPFDARVNPAPQAGLYTAVLSAAGAVPGIEGAGFGAISVDGNGAVTIAGSLPDGRAFRQQARIGGEGQWPCHVNLRPVYKQAGSLVGWLHFDGEPSPSARGSLTWTRPAVSPYLQQSIQELELASSTYTVSRSGTKILDFTEGAFVLTGPGFDMPLTNRFVLDTNNKVTDTEGNRLRLTFNRRTGTFAGSIAYPLSREPLPFKGAVLQSLNCGYGHYLLPDKSTGSVWLGPVDRRRLPMPGIDN